MDMNMVYLLTAANVEMDGGTNTRKRHCSRWCVTTSPNVVSSTPDLMNKATIWTHIMQIKQWRLSSLQTDCRNRRSCLQALRMARMAGDDVISWSASVILRMSTWEEA